MQIKGCVQLHQDNPSTDVLQVFTYADTGERSWDIIREGEPHNTGWDKPEVPGRDHPSFSNFVLWFEYEDV